MQHPGYDAFDDPYCYEGTFVLKNKADILDPDELEAFELEMTSLRAEEPLPRGRFGPAHYCNIHKHLFQDVYGWAGRYRKVRTAKDGNVFCYPEFIDDQMRALFESLSDGSLMPGCTANDFTNSAARFLAELNAIHPFREGNGRTQLSFLFLLAIRAGHPIDLTQIQPAPFLQAMIASFGGNTALLRQEIEQLVVVD